MDVYDELLAAALFIVFSTFMLWVFRKLWAVRKRKTINDTSSKSGHYWSPIEHEEQHNYCSGCKEHIVSGYECDNCLLKVDNVSFYYKKVKNEDEKTGKNHNKDYEEEKEQKWPIDCR
ncbi:hypothetical protein B9Z55_024118 [Caenorhabditis nigoni]|nr:hypothetical protein B9Z55_024118 [Caenorhabditis nigoni]